MRYVAYLPGKPMNPVMRALAMVAGVAIFALLVIFGAFILCAVLAVGTIAYGVYRWRHRHDASPAWVRTKRNGDTLDGEYTVVEQRDD